jgi:hypothetical protein
MQKLYLAEDETCLHAIGDFDMTGTFKLSVKDGVIGNSGDGCHKFDASISNYAYDDLSTTTTDRMKEDPRELCMKLLKVETKHKPLLHCKLLNNSPPGVNLDMKITLDKNKMLMTFDQTSQLKGKYKWQIRSV